MTQPSLFASDQTGNLSRPGQNLGTGDVDALFIEEWVGEVQAILDQASVFRDFIPARPAMGTNELTVPRVGAATTARVVPGQFEDASVTQFGEVSVKVSDMIFSRDIVPLLEGIQNYYDQNPYLIRNQAIALAKDWDTAHLTRAIKGAMTDATGLPTGILGGTDVELAAAGDESDADKLVQGIHDVVIGMKNKRYDPVMMGARIIVNPTTYGVLLNNNKLLNSDFSMGNGDFSEGKFMTIFGIPVMETSYFDTVDMAAHPLGSDYQVTGDEADAVVLIVGPDGLLTGESKSLDAEIYPDRKRFSTFIDSVIAFGTTGMRLEGLGVVRSFSA